MFVVGGYLVSILKKFGFRLEYVPPKSSRSFVGVPCLIRLLFDTGAVVKL